MIISEALAVFIAVVFCSVSQKRAGSPALPGCRSSPWVSGGQLGRSPLQRPSDAPLRRSGLQEPVSQTAKQRSPRGRRRRRGVPLRGRAESGRCAPRQQVLERQGRPPRCPPPRGLPAAPAGGGARRGSRGSPAPPGHPRSAGGCAAGPACPG